MDIDVIYSNRLLKNDMRGSLHDALMRESSLMYAQAVAYVDAEWLKENIHHIYNWISDGNGMLDPSTLLTLIHSLWRHWKAGDALLNPEIIKIFELVISLRNDLNYAFFIDKDLHRMLTQTIDQSKVGK
jgi:hypothetical protein